MYNFTRPLWALIAALPLALGLSYLEVKTTQPILIAHTLTYVSEKIIDSKKESISGVTQGWQAGVEKDLQTHEYDINYQEGVKAFQSPNRAQNLRITFKGASMEVQDREEAEAWQGSLSLTSVSRGVESIKIDVNSTPEVEANRALFTSTEGSATSVQYINNAGGTRQNFILNSRPDGSGELALEVSVSGELALTSVDNGTATLITTTGQQLSYSGLEAWDALGTPITAHMEMRDNHTLALVVEDAGAKYPITVDPILTTIQAQLESNQANAYFGFSASGAGDVNGDGFSDVIIGAYNYDNGQTDEGVAFIYHGSSTGVTSIIQAQLESNQSDAFAGYSVSGAGDVNGDGFSDVIVGAINYDNGHNNEGAAFVYHGSSTGVSTTVKAHRVQPSR